MFIKVRSRHGSHDVIRGKVPTKVRALVRFGSTTPLVNVFPNAVKNGKKIVEINTTDAVKTSANKLLMKQAFAKVGVKTADWFVWKDDHLSKVIGYDKGNIYQKEDAPYPLVAKHLFGSRGTGNHLLNSQKELEAWIRGKDLRQYIFEKFYDYSREYRLHVTKAGCFYTCRKMLKNDVPKENRWYRNDSNSSWMVEENPLFDRPVNWKDIEAECVKALVAVGLDVGAIDLKVQTSKDKEGKVRKNPEFIVIETNSAPSFGDITSKKYNEILPKIVDSKL